MRTLRRNHHSLLRKTCLLGASLVVALSLGSMSVNSNNIPVHAHRLASYDISQWQGYITKHQAKHLKHEVHFMILRAQDGGAQSDSKIRHNIHLMNRYHIPYGVYSYSLYRNSTQARAEAKMLYRRAPHARFYINDAEMNYAHGRMNSATKAWSKELHKLTNRPVILYSYLGFMGHFNHRTRRTYNGIWLAAYSRHAPFTNFHYDLWQFTSNHYSHALRRRLDASKFPKHAKPLTFWISGSNNNKVSLKPANTKSATKIYNGNQNIQQSAELQADKTSDNWNTSDINPNKPKTHKIKRNHHIKNTNHKHHRKRHILIFH